MSIFISQKCDAGCGIPRNKHTEQQRRKCSKIKQHLRLVGKLPAEPINQKSKVYALPPRSIPSRFYSE